MTHALLRKLTTLLNDLDREQIGYTLRHDREDSVTVDVAVPGERWEIELLVDGSVEIERFVSNGVIFDGSILGELFGRYAQPAIATGRCEQSAEPGLDHNSGRTAAHM